MFTYRGNERNNDFFIEPRVWTYYRYFCWIFGSFKNIFYTSVSVEFQGKCKINSDDTSTTTKSWNFEFGMKMTPPSILFWNDLIEYDFWFIVMISHTRRFYWEKGRKFEKWVRNSSNKCRSVFERYDENEQLFICSSDFSSRLFNPLKVRLMASERVIGIWCRLKAFSAG